MFQPFDQKLTFICKFCGGKTCKHENYLSYPNSAITGLNSDWITTNILATQRPSSRIIKEFDIIKQFKENGINAIFNLQEPGEHPYCGDGINPISGFSYFPEEFYENGIYFFNFGWRDMTATSPDVILKIVKQMSFSLANGDKVAVHCHAGRGRTCMIIAAWMIYNDNMSAKEAIRHVRSKRKDAIQKKSQEKVLYDFEREINESRGIFLYTPRYGLDEYLYHQKKMHALSLNSAERYVIKLVLVVLERLETLVKCNICKINDVLNAFYALNDKESFTEPWGDKHEKFLKQFKERINGNNYEVSDIEDPRYLTQILLDFFDGFATPPIQPRFIDAIYSKIHHDDDDEDTKLTKNIKDQIFKEFNKREFFLVECFARFFASLLAFDETCSDQISSTALRVCISLTLSRKKLDKLFFKRSVIGDHKEDDKVMHLKIFLLKWIENFNEAFTENFLLQKGSLKINERKVKEKLIKKGLQNHSYLSKILNKNIKNTRNKDVSCDISQSMSSILEEDEHENLEKEEESIRKSGSSITSISSMTSPPKSIFIRKIQRSGIQRDIKVQSLNLARITPENTPKKQNELQARSAPTSNHKKVNAYTFSTPKAEVAHVRSPMKSLLKEGSVSEKTKEHYQTFFGEDAVGNEKENEKKDYHLDDMMIRITKMSKEKQEKIFRKLLEMQLGKNV